MRPMSFVIIPELILNGSKNVTRKVSEPADDDIVELDDDGTFAVVADCDMLPGAWTAIFHDDTEAALYAAWRREQGSGDSDGYTTGAMSALRATGSITLDAANTEESVLG